MKHFALHFPKILPVAAAAIVTLCMPHALHADAVAGKGTFDKSCKGCHAADGKGNPAIGKAMKVELRALGSKEVLAKPDGELSKNITEGIGKMKPISSLPAGDVKSVIEYVRTLKN